MPKFKDNEQTKGGVKRRATRRLKRVGPIAGVSKKGGITGREARAIKRASAALKEGRPKPESFDPLAPVTGKSFKRELGAAEKLQFGDQDRELDREGRRLEQNSANVGGYWDDYREALRQATERIRADNVSAATASESRATSVRDQDLARQRASDAQASEGQKQLGLAPVQTSEGYRAVEGARTQAAGETDRSRERGLTRVAQFEGQGATASLGKLQALAREQARRRENAEDKQDLAAKKGAFRVDFRGRTRESEREWAAIQQEFGLKKKEFKADNSLKKLELRAQQRIAELYSGAKLASAQAQIEVAKKQLRGKEISRRKYVEVLNRYQGLGGGKGPGGNGPGSGPGGSLAPWERDKISNAVSALVNTGAGLEDRGRALAKLQKRGVPLRLARIAWGRYVKKHLKSRVQGPGTFPRNKGQ